MPNKNEKIDSPQICSTRHTTMMFNRLKIDSPQIISTVFMVPSNIFTEHFSSLAIPLDVNEAQNKTDQSMRKSPSPSSTSVLKNARYDV